jgi:hypothetical protein
VGDSHDAKDLETDLLARTEEAVEAAARIREESEKLAAPKESGLTTRCAWCGRYRMRNAWVVLAHVPPEVQGEATTHGICPDCVAVLRHSGMSA